MPDDTDLTPQDHGVESPDQQHQASLIQLALTELQERRDALQQEIDTLTQRKQQLETEMAAENN